MYLLNRLHECVLLHLILQEGGRVLWTVMEMGGRGGE